MTEKKIKQVRLAEAIGVDKSTTTQNKILSLKSAFNRIERACVLELVSNIAKFFNVPPEFFLYTDKERQALEHIKKGDTQVICPRTIWDQVSELNCNEIDDLMVMLKLLKKHKQDA